MSRNKAFILCALVLSLVVPFSGSELISEEQMTAQSFNYNTSVVERGDFVKTGTLNASVYYNRYAKMRFFGAGAHFVQYDVRKGDEVKAGDVLAELVVDGSRAELTALKMRLDREKDEYDTEVQKREDALEAQRKAASQETDEAQAEIADLEYQKSELALEQYKFQTEYSLNDLQRQIDELQEKYDDNKITAPYDGEVQAINASVKTGDAITDGESIGTMYDPDVFLLVAKDDGMLRYNMRVEVQSGSRNNRVTYTGTVVAADNVLPEELARGYAAIRLDEGQEYDVDDLKNLSVSYDMIHLGNVLLVARRAMKMDQGDYYASILTGDMVQKRVVNFSLYNTDVGIALQGLEEGWEVIIN